MTHTDLRNEILEILNNRDTPSGQADSIMELLATQLELKKEPFLLNRLDLFSILNRCKNQAAHLPARVFVGGEEIDPSDTKIIAYVEGVVSYLGSKNCMRKAVLVNYKQPDTESIEEY